MQEYQELLKMLKVANLSIQILHRHLIDQYAWFGNHEQLGDYYEHVQDDVDKFSELGLAIGAEEPSIEQSLEAYKEVEIKDRDAKTSFEMTQELFNNIVAQINRISDVSDDVKNKLQEAQEYYRLEADFKLARIIK